MVDGKETRGRRARKLLIASVGVASVNYAAIGCDDDGSITTVANLMAPPYAGSPGQAGKGGQAGNGGQGGEGGAPEGGSAGGSG